MEGCTTNRNRILRSFPLHEDSVYHWGDVLEAAYHRLGGRRVKLLVLDPPSLGALEWPAGLAGHLIVPWDRQEEMASLLGTRYGKTHPIRVVTELYDGATELTDPLVFVDGDSGEVRSKLRGQSRIAKRCSINFVSSNALCIGVVRYMTVSSLPCGEAVYACRAL